MVIASVLTSVSTFPDEFVGSDPISRHCPSESIPIGSHIKMYHFEALKSISTAKERGGTEVSWLFSLTQALLKLNSIIFYLYIYMFTFTALPAAC